jgi:hypothetical protein
MDEMKEEPSKFKRSLAALLEGHSNECILDAILKRIPEADLCQAMLRVFERQNTVMSPAFPGDAIMCAIGLGSTLVYGVSSANIDVQPFEDFHLDRLIISSAVAKYFLVTDIKVGGESQFQSPGCIPGLSFAENVFAIKLKGDMVRPSQFITVSVTNQAPNGCNFQGVLIGHIDRNWPSGKAAALEEVA